MAITSKIDVQALELEHVLQTYRRQPVVFERGEGVRLFDDRGRAYLDFVSGIGVASLGHGHAGLARALCCNSGTEAVEACLKFARRYWHTRGEPRAKFVAFAHSFHGRTMGSLSV